MSQSTKVTGAKFNLFNNMKNRGIPAMKEQCRYLERLAPHYISLPKLVEVTYVGMFAYDTKDMVLLNQRKMACLRKVERLLYAIVDMETKHGIPHADEITLTKTPGAKK